MSFDQLWETLTRVDGVEESASAFKDGPALWVDGTEIAYLDRECALEVRLTRAVIRARRADLQADTRVRLRASSSADWLEVEICNAADEAFVVTLVQEAVAAHRPPPGATPRPAPTGEALERRRRFH